MCDLPLLHNHVINAWMQPQSLAGICQFRSLLMAHFSVVGFVALVAVPRFAFVGFLFFAAGSASPVAVASDADLLAGTVFWFLLPLGRPPRPPLVLAAGGAALGSASEGAVVSLA
jgi:hypothetical protein